MYIKSLLNFKKYYLLIVPAVILVLTIILSVVICEYQSIQEYSRFNATGYSIADRYDSEQLKVLFKEESSLNDIKEVYDKFKSQWGSELLVMTEQPIHIYDNIHNNNFVYGYGDIDEEMLDFNRLNCFQMNASALESSDIGLVCGRVFDESEYIYRQTIPVLLGYNYKEYFNLNDTFLIRYLGCDIEAKVVGVLSEGACAAKTNYSCLDNYIVMPALEFLENPSNEEEKRFQIKVYLGHTNSYIYTDKSVLKVQGELDDICKSVEVDPYIIMGVLPIDLFGMGFAKSINLMLVSILVVCVLCVAAMSYLVWRKHEAIIRGMEVKSEIKIDKLLLAIIVEDLIWVLMAAIPCIVLSVSVLYIFNVETLVVIVILCHIWALVPVISLLNLLKIYLKKGQK